MWNVIFSGIFGVGLFALLGRRIGKTLYPEETKGIGTLMGALTLVAIFSCVGALIYYVLPVNALTYGIAAGIIVAGTVLATRSSQRVTFAPSQDTFSLRLLPPIFVVAIALGAWWYALLTHPITDAVRSPWLVLSPATIVAPVLALLVSAGVLRRHRAIGTVLFASTLFSIFASAATLFPLGYGFDPFLHRATMFHIAEHGTITPKPLYYIGAYAIELFANLLGGFPLFSVDVLLLPILGALTFTVATRRLPIGSALFFIGLSNFLTTTPQSLGYLFALLTVISIPPATTNDQRPTHAVAPIIFALAAFLAHPIAGVPAIMFVALTTFRSRILRAGTAIASTVALPAMFVAQAALHHAPISLSWNTLWRFDLLPLNGFLFSNGNTWLDTLYLVGANVELVVLVLAIVGTVLFRGTLSARERNGIIIAGALVISFVLVSLGIDFTYLISYERQDFALRFLLLATIFALPLIDRTIAHVWTAIGASHRAFGTTCAAIFLFGVTYAAFPRHDGYARSAAFNVSQADIDTVYAIHAKEDEDADYIVLANQTTAAAALQEFGFRKYYHTDIFYYPIPTGGALYQKYLDVLDTESNTREVALLEAMDLPCVQKEYVVVNEYWWKSDQVIERLKDLTDNWFEIDGGKTTVFTFTADELRERVHTPPCTP